MAINSMTGFARADGRHEALAWTWEVRSVNGRGLDVRVRVPPGYDALELRARELTAQRMARGSITLSLAVKRAETPAAIRINEAVLQQVLDAVDRLRARTEMAPPSAASLLAIKGVLETVEPDAEQPGSEARDRAIAQTLAEALEGTRTARAAEGGRLASVVSSQLDRIERLVAVIETAPARTPDAVQRRLREQIARLVDGGPVLDETRLYQEAVLIAARADVEEELKRLRAHVAAARDLLTAGEPVGRKLDFLAQEFNREANTLCSKSNDTDITRAGLDLKSVIDQMREQVQNIE
ncbi:MAG: YicC/YloC family endoribonuclease [Hyphomicrobiaceae bacterium]|jgi:uncharacterized protein (TIGR00255 family)